MSSAALPSPQFDALPWGAHRRFALTDDALFEACGVRIAFTGRVGGESAGPYASLNTGAHVDDDLHAVAQNRRTVLRAVGAEAAPLIVPNQVHGTRVLRIADYVDIGRVVNEAIEGADALPIGVSAVAALLNFADCLPLILVAPSGRFSVVHAGWRGAVVRISSAAVRMLAESGEDPRTLNAYIGPHIGAECFEVDGEVAAQFADEFGEGVLRDACHVDLSAVVACDLVDAGVTADRIADCDICTVCHSDEYFSYRASGGTCGRQSAVAYRPHSD